MVPMSCLLLTLKWIKVTFDTQYCEIRKDTRRMRSGACQDDRSKEKGNRKAQEKGKNGIKHRGATTNGHPSKIAAQ